MSQSCDIVATRGGFRLQARFDSAARVVAVEGPSGAGKTTLLHALAGLAPVERGRFCVDGQRILDTEAGLSPPPHARGIGYVFQDARLFPHLTVAGNIAFAAPRRDPAVLRPLIDLLDLQPLLPRWPRNLSGGEARRVAVARALASDPHLLLLDEPFAGLDGARREELLGYLTALKANSRLPMLLVSHDRRDAAALADDRVAIRDGRIG